MGTDYAEKERTFIADLQQDTGKDLDGWMNAISSAGHANRNDIIDWLRHQGFPFAKASWLERIHHNGGRLIYAGGIATTETPRERPVRSSPQIVSDGRAGERFQTPLIVENTDHNITSFQAFDEDVALALAAAKGLRPLADFILKEIQRLVPATTFAAKPPLVIATSQKPFLALWPSPKRLRIYADYGSSGDGLVQPAEPVLKASPPFAQMITLDDARRVDHAFHASIAAAAARVNA